MLPEGYPHANGTRHDPRAGIGWACPYRRPLETPVLRLLGWLVVIWLALSIIGAVIKGLFWLTVLALLLAGATLALGWSKRGRQELPRGR